MAVPFVTAPTYAVRADLARLGQLPAHVRDAGPPTLVRLDADLLAYKGLVGRREPLLGWLRGW